jgi:hypothetical protein
MAGSPRCALMPQAFRFEERMPSRPKYASETEKTRIENFNVNANQD